MIDLCPVIGIRASIGIRAGQPLGYQGPFVRRPTHGRRSTFYLLHHRPTFAVFFPFQWEGGLVKRMVERSATKTVPTL
jgi:hypothetical protein